jgi:hypothetical protein
VTKTYQASFWFLTPLLRTSGPKGHGLNALATLMPRAIAAVLAVGHGWRTRPAGRTAVLERHRWVRSTTSRPPPSLATSRRISAPIAARSRWSSTWPGKLTYDVTFPMFAKVETAGANQSPIYRYLGTSGHLPAWNFAKYLIGKDGRIIAFFPSQVASIACQSGRHRDLVTVRSTLGAGVSRQSRGNRQLGGTIPTLVDGIRSLVLADRRLVASIGWQSRGSRDAGIRETSQGVEISHQSGRFSSRRRHDPFVGPRRSGIEYGGPTASRTDGPPCLILALCCAAAVLGNLRVRRLIP